jgi:hypothetical protein
MTQEKQDRIKHQRIRAELVARMQNRGSLKAAVKRSGHSQTDYLWFLYDEIAAGVEADMLRMETARLKTRALRAQFEMAQNLLN